MSLSFTPNTSIRSINILILTTDRVEECHDQNEAIFGSTRVENQLKQLKEPTAEDCAAAIQNAINEFSQKVDPHDDITILSIQFSPTQKKLSNGGTVI